MRPESRAALALVVIALLLAALALTLGAAQARASDGGMAGMPGMTEEEMQAMGQPAAAPASTDGHESETVMDPHMSMGGGAVNWFVIGGFIVLVVGSTIGAMATKRHLARRMASGELAGAGALDV